MGQVRQGFRVELAPGEVQQAAMLRHAGLFRVVENFCLDVFRENLRVREEQQAAGVPENQLRAVPSTAVDFEQLWRAEHPQRFGWFAGSGLSSRIPKEACRVRAAGLRNFWDTRRAATGGRSARFPRLRTRKQGPRFRYDAGRAHPAGERLVYLPGIGAVATRESLTWLLVRLADGRARITGSTVRRRHGRWWVSLHLQIDRDEINTRRRVSPRAPACTISGAGPEVFAVLTDQDGSCEQVPVPAGVVRAQRRARRAERSLGRSRPGSRNRADAHTRLFAAQLGFAHAREDFLHQLTTRLARTKRVVHVSPAGSPERVGGRLGRRAVTEFLYQLGYKTLWYGSALDLPPPGAGPVDSPARSG